MERGWYVWTWQLPVLCGRLKIGTTFRKTKNDHHEVRYELLSHGRIPMEIDLDLPGTDKTPAVRLKQNEGVLEIIGCSIPENADRFFSPIQDRVERYSATPHARTSITIQLSYFNSSSSKYLLDLLKRLDDLHASGRSQVVLHWQFTNGDLDMKEAGEDYRSLVEFPVKLKEVEG